MAGVRVALGFANRAAIAENNLGFRLTEAYLASEPDVRVERFFLTPELQAEHAARTASAGRRRAATRSGREMPPAHERRARGSARASRGTSAYLAAADLVLFSLSYEGDAPHVPLMLAAGGMPPAAGDRRRGHPLVVGGGAAVMINPEPLARFFDLFLVGEAEALLSGFLARWRAVRGAPRAEAIGALAGLPGAIAPWLRYHRCWREAGGRLSATDTVLLTDAAAAGERADGRGGAPRVSATPSSPACGGAGATVAPVHADAPVTTVSWDAADARPRAARLSQATHFSESLLLELGRGCPRRCRFCVASRIYAPVRMHPAAALSAHARAHSAPGETVGLLSLSAGDHPGLALLVADLCQSGRRLAISSLPATFRQREAVRALVASGAKTLTIAPETGSERLRALAGKPLADDAIVRTVALLGAEGVRHLRTYFIIGLPFERDTDRAAIPALLAAMRKRLPATCRLSATVNIFVPKPHTPFQWAPLAPLAELRTAGERLRRETPAGVSLKVKSARSARLHTALTRGDCRWGSLLEQHAAGGGSLMTLLQQTTGGLEPLTGELAPTGRLPWGYLETAAQRRALREEWETAAREAAVD